MEAGASTSRHILATRWWDRASFVVVLLAFLAVLWVLPITPVAAALQRTAEDLGPWSFVLFILVNVLLGVFSLPVWPMPFVAGALFGVLWGSVVASFSCVLTAAITFLIARMIGKFKLRDWLEASPRMRALENTVRAGSWKVVVAVRLAHFLPFGMQNYGFGLTRISLRTFLLTTWIVTLPGTILQVWLGHLGFTSLEGWQDAASADWTTWGMRIAGVVGLGIAVVYLGWLLKRVYTRNVASELEEQLKVETKGEGASSSSVWLPVFALVVAAGAAWSVVERDAVRGFVERQFQAESHTSDAGERG